MGFGLLFVPLVGGYLFLKCCNFTKYSVSRESGYKLVFESAATGIILLVASRIIIRLAMLSPIAEHAVALWSNVTSIQYSGTLITAFILGPIAATVVNLCYDEAAGARRAVKKTDNSMESLILESMKPTELIEVTLESNKVYIGWVLGAHIANLERKYIEVSPLYSGYRDRGTQEMKLLTNYAQAFADHPDQIKKGHEYRLRIVIPVSQIRTIRPFDIEYYSLFIGAKTTDAVDK